MSTKNDVTGPSSLLGGIGLSVDTPCGPRQRRRSGCPFHIHPTARAATVPVRATAQSSRRRSTNRPSCFLPGPGTMLMIVARDKSQAPLSRRARLPDSYPSLRRHGPGVQTTLARSELSSRFSRLCKEAIAPKCVVLGKRRAVSLRVGRYIHAPLSLSVRAQSPRSGRSLICAVRRIPTGEARCAIGLSRTGFQKMASLPRQCVTVASAQTGVFA